MGDAERRRAPRIRCELPLQYRSAGSGGAWVTTTTYDVSTSGLLFYTPQPAALGSMLAIELAVTRERRIPIEARVVRVQEAGDAHGYGVGVTYTKIDEADRQSIFTSVELMDIARLLEQTVASEASDLHLSVGHAPMMRIGGTLKPMAVEPLTAEQLKRMVYVLLNDKQRELFEREYELDFAFSMSPTTRFRVNVHLQRGYVEATFRRVTSHIRTLQDLRLPPVVESFARLQSGLVIITGSTGAGKTTTMAAMVDLINSARSGVVITLERPIEYVHPYKQSIIKQREVETDTKSYATAIRQAMRQDPDVIVVGEILDRETMATALEAADTGHLVLATLPSPDVVQALLRVVNLFPAEQRDQARIQLSNVLQGMLCQKLLPRSDRPGERVLAAEVLVNIPAMAHIIRENRLEQVRVLMQTHAKAGMRLMDESLEELYRQGTISKQTFMEHSQDKALRLDIGTSQGATAGEEVPRQRKRRWL